MMADMLTVVEQFLLFETIMPKTIPVIRDIRYQLAVNRGGPTQMVQLTIVIRSAY